MKPKPKEKLKVLAEMIEIDVAFLEECVQHGAVQLANLSERDEDLTPPRLARLRRLQRICRSLDVDVFAGSIIVDLLERMEQMERDLEWLRARMGIHEK